MTDINIPIPGTKQAAVLDSSSCLNKAEPDELVFILREKDPLFVNVVRAWAAMCHGGTQHGIHEQSKIDEAYQIANLAAARRANRYGHPRT